MSTKFARFILIAPVPIETVDAVVDVITLFVMSAEVAGL
jgi:hypothetical protein